MAAPDIRIMNFSLQEDTRLPYHVEVFSEENCMLFALTREVGPTIARCALTFLEREPIGVERARKQHACYERLLEALGVKLIALPAEADLPDAVFVEDTAVVVGEVAVMTRPMLESRRQEVRSVAEVLSPFRPLLCIETPGTLEGGDVVGIGRTLYVGLSRRTNEEGAEQLAKLLAPWDYEVRKVAVRGCLHLKTGCTHLGDGAVLANLDCIDTSAFDGMRVLAVPDGEDGAANTLRIGETVVLSASFPRTRALLEAEGMCTAPIDVSELEKAEAGVTCCSILFDAVETG
jgi:dimethylargininase